MSVDLHEDAGRAAPAAGAVPPAIELIGIDKRFGPVHANRAVDLQVIGGTIHGIIGENGAGKSTLMSILYGYYQADAGEIRVKGAPRHIRHSQDAIAAGIGMVHQHFMLVDDFSVLENVVLGVEQGPLLSGGLAAARAALKELADTYGLAVDPDAPVHDLPVGLQQRVEILKALYRGAEVLILDEPTAVLTPQEVDDLFGNLRRLRAEGKTIVFISHILDEVLGIADRITVLRRGQVIGTLPAAGATKGQIAEMMVGRPVVLELPVPAVEPGEIRLEMDRVVVMGPRGRPAVREASFAVRGGEIYGIAGVEGNGQTELVEAL
ncbi:MAG TPA: ATP-binding cassette domain-containing protein, partial [Dongiaceae bacterium]|nr:ATP-binding cassette domain-containing protein [Dongiaceae bacterium]